jgi:hypothetical protein
VFGFTLWPLLHQEISAPSSPHELDWRLGVSQSRSANGGWEKNPTSVSNRTLIIPLTDDSVERSIPVRCFLISLKALDVYEVYFRVPRDCTFWLVISLDYLTDELTWCHTNVKSQTEKSDSFICRPPKYFALLVFIFFRVSLTWWRTNIAARSLWLSYW